jgi:hypothetical protein
MKDQSTDKARIFEKQIVNELRLLREQIALVLPHESLEDYANPRRILSAYRKALKEYPPHLPLT